MFGWSNIQKEINIFFQFEAENLAKFGLLNAHLWTLNISASSALLFPERV